MTPLMIILKVLLLFSALTLAQPSRHRSRHDNAHVGRDAAIHQHARHAAETPLAQNINLRAEYKAKIALRDAALEIIASVDSTGIQAHEHNAPRDAVSPTTNPADLQTRINEIEAALQSLINLLANEYGITLDFGSAASGLVPSPSSTAAPTTGSIVTASSSIPVQTPIILPIPGSIVAEPPSSFAPDFPPSTAEPSTIQPSTPTPSAPSSPSSNSTRAYTFVPNSHSNVAVYYGQTDQTRSVPLLTLCADPAVDIIILGFVNNFFTPYPSGPYPTLNMGPNCWAASTAQHTAGAGGLLDCVGGGFADLVNQCQKTYGKKVLLSLGGAVGYSDTRIPSEAAAVKFADTLWNLFLGGSGLAILRPFGTGVVLDGIDIDNESPENALHLPTLVSTLRAHFSTARTQKPYYLSAAPQCPRPDASIPLTTLQTQIDFVWPQFYNNPACNLNTGSAFLASLQAWGNDLSSNAAGFVNVGNGVVAPRLLVGSTAFGGAGSGWVGGVGFEDVVGQVLGQVGSVGGNFGGFMFWDGAYGEESAAVDGVGVSYMRVVKGILGA